MKEMIKIGDKEIQKIEYKGIPVITTKLLAEFYECDTVKLQQNFNNNKDKYQLGKHYFILEGEELQSFLRLENFESQNISKIRSLTLWTEYGTLLHAKSLNTKKAWNIYETLMECYFKIKNKIVQPQSENEIVLMGYKILMERVKTLENKVTKDKSKVEFYDTVADSSDAFDLGSCAKLLKLSYGRNILLAKLRKKKILMQDNTPYQEYIDRGYFRGILQSYEKPNGETFTYKKTLCNTKGLDFIRRLLKKAA